LIESLQYLDKYGEVDINDDTPGRLLVTITYSKNMTVGDGAQIVTGLFQKVCNKDVQIYHMAANVESVSFFISYPAQLNITPKVA
jgi:hypothetical protein